MENLKESGNKKPFNIKHRSFFFARDILRFVRHCNYDKVHFSMFDQLIRSGTSIGANLVEGKAGSTRKDWRNFFTIALKSANEVKYWLCLLKEIVPDNIIMINTLIKEANEISKIIASIIVSDKVNKSEASQF